MRNRLLGRKARIAIAVATLLLIAAPWTGEAQQTGKVWRIGYLSLTSDTASYRPWLGALRDGLRDLGYVEGENIAIEARYAAGDVARLSGLAAELVRLTIDVLVAAPAGSARALRPRSPRHVSREPAPRRERTGSPPTSAIRWA